MNRNSLNRVFLIFGHFSISHEGSGYQVFAVHYRSVFRHGHKATFRALQHSS